MDWSPGRCRAPALVAALTENLSHNVTVQYVAAEPRDIDDPLMTVTVLDVRVKPDLTVGYVMGVGDEVPQAIEQLGARVDLLPEDQLAWGDLSGYDVIMTGVRAYERRALGPHDVRSLGAEHGVVGRTPAVALDAEPRESEAVTSGGRR